ncbi:MAG: hypothetical protein EZS28_022765 [Streblomastix strix]|uniref:Right handed beta helix domain-containing protein n=1 Tax=Streblomastix strix TaxID=222440 RepID=A0A5J4VGI5_9EUKA|nr:MAG: hypothetical protein EZS28_022765 [Streblomastix strix]
MYFVLLLLVSSFINVHGIEYYVNHLGSDESTCTSTSQSCQTLGANSIKDNINAKNTVIIYVVDTTSISYQLTIRETSSPRILRNFPDSSTATSEIHINTGGYFDIQGSVEFKFINFVVESGPNRIIDGQASFEIITINNCKMTMGNQVEQIQSSLVYLEYNGILNIDNLTVKDIRSTQNIIFISGASEVNIDNSLFENITNSNSNGIIHGYLYATQQKLYVTRTQFIQCKSTASNSQGGALDITLNEQSEVNLNQVDFTECESNKGGGMNLQLQHESKLTLESCTFTGCISNSDGGGIFAQLERETYFTLTSCSFTQCKSNGNGGGLYAFIDEASIEIDNKCNFYRCLSKAGNGGGIYIDSRYISILQFKMSAILQECKAKYSSSSTKPTGYGGGIFIGERETFDSTQTIFDLNEMKIEGNKADKLGQSLFVAMADIEKWCLQGNAGYYVKGNYSDTLSNENELMCIEVNQNTFDGYSDTEIRSNSKYLEPYWNLDACQIDDERDECKCIPIGDMHTHCAGVTILCNKASQSELAGVSTDICGCIPIGDLRTSECPETIPCDKASSTNLTGLPKKICDCRSIGDPRRKRCPTSTPCESATAVELEDVPVGLCACLVIGDLRQTECSQSQDCETKSTEELKSVPVGFCPCISIGDPRSECVDTVACDKASKEDLTGLPTNICTCVGFGDPRQPECYETKPCEAAPAEKLEKIPISLCECFTIGDPREPCNICTGTGDKEDCICTSTFHPATCVCPHNDEIYTEEICSADKSVHVDCSQITIETSEVDCPCPSDPDQLDQDPRKDTICKTTGKEASGSIRALQSVIVVAVTIPILAVFF